MIFCVGFAEFHPYLMLSFNFVYHICPCYYQLACYYVNNTSFIKVTIALYLDVLVDTHKTANRLHFFLVL